MTLALSGRFASMTPGLDEVAQDRRFPERPARFEPVKAFDKDQTCTILSDHDRQLLPILEDVGSQGLHLFGVERIATLQGHIDARNGD